jgi:hypothetical protein
VVLSPANIHDPAATEWRKLVDGPLISGEGERSAHATEPRAAPDGSFHMVWVWRDTPDRATNHTLSHARSDDLLSWTDAAGKPLALPITLATGDVVDPVPSGGGLINLNRELGFDAPGGRDSGAQELRTRASNRAGSAGRASGASSYQRLCAERSAL